MVDPGLPPTDPDGPRSPPRWAIWLGGVLSAAMLAAVAFQLRHISPATLQMLRRLPPTVFASFGLLYLSQPLSDLAIYRRVWNLPASAFPMLMRKTAMNEAVLGYSGEAYLFFWARRRAHMAVARFPVIKDVNILSSIVGFAGTLATLVVAMLSAPQLDFGRLLRPFLWPAAGVTAVVLVVLVSARRVFSLPREDLVFVAAVHTARITAIGALTILTWTLAMPAVPLTDWFVLLAIGMLGQRIPFITNSALVAGNAILLLLGPGSSFAVLLAALAAATLVTHLTVLAVLGVAGLAPRFAARAPAA